MQGLAKDKADHVSLDFLDSVKRGGKDIATRCTMFSLLVELVESVKKRDLYYWTFCTPKKKESIYGVCGVSKRGTLSELCKTPQKRKSDKINQ